MRIRPFQEADAERVVALWQRCGLTRPWNDPQRDIARKLKVQRHWFFVGEAGGALVASAMAGYDGHRGWINYLAVDPDCRRRGHARALMARVEAALREAGCPKLNLQVRHGNDEALAFYRALGYVEDAVTSFGKRLIDDTDAREIPPPAPQEVVLASHNAKKLREMQALLAPLGWQVRLVSEFSTEAPEETAGTFVENALLKARAAAQVSGLPAIADDSGLEVEALGGAPGVHSARYAGTQGDDEANNRKLLAELQGRPPAGRGASFVSLMVYLRHAGDPTPVIAEGRWRGHILDAPRGAGGFGYDPLFQVPEFGCTAAELAPAVKNAHSHRARAAAELLERLRR